MKEDHRRLQIAESITDVSGHADPKWALELAEEDAGSAVIRIVTKNGHEVQVHIDERHIEIRGTDSQLVSFVRSANVVQIHPRMTGDGNVFGKDIPQKRWNV
jgi:hypothetical protein